MRREPSEDVSIIGLVNVLLRYRRQVLALGLLTSVVLTGTVALRERTFRASATFVPQAGRANPNLAGVAAQFGLSMPAGEATQSPQFYADLLRSSGILHAAVASVYELPTDRRSRQVTLAEVFRAAEPDSLMRMDVTARELGRRMAVDVSPRTSVVTLAVQTPEPELSRQVVARLLELLNEFNLATRQSQATSERAFVERRLREVGDELRAAESRLEGFLLRNRDYGNSPSLRLSQERLHRDVAHQQQLYTSLAQAFEQARIDEVRDTPVITVIEPPRAPVKPDSRGLLTRAVLGLVLGLIAGAALAFIRHLLARAREVEASEYQEFADLRREAMQDLTRPWRLLVPRRHAIR